MSVLQGEFTSSAKPTAQVIPDQTVPAMIEFMGPAGSGKSTLIKRLLTESVIELQAIKTPSTRESFLKLPGLGKMIASSWNSRTSDRKLHWAEIRSMIYLEAWKNIDKNPRQHSVLFDHGPAFRLATLLEYGPTMIKSDRFRKWYQENLHFWSNSLSHVVWLDAPDDVLLERIKTREQQHVCQNMQRTNAFDYLKKYRAALESTVNQMQSSGKVIVTRFNSERSSTEEIAGQVSNALCLN